MVQRRLRVICVFFGICLTVFFICHYYHQILIFGTIFYWKLNLRELKQTASYLHCSTINKTRVDELRNELNRFTQHHEPVLVQDNIHVDYKYYGNYFKESFTIDKSKRELLAKTFPPNKTMFSKCSIVGNGGILKNSSCGADIDSSDFVLRMNVPQIQGFVKDAGRKTNFTSVACSSASLTEDGVPCGAFHAAKFIKGLKSFNGYIMWVPSSWTHAPSMKSAFIFAEILRKNSNLQLVLSNAIYSQKFSEYWHINGKILSSGMTMVSIAISFCEEIHLYGFWPFPFSASGNSLPMHYSEDLPWTSYRQTHDYPAEFDLLTKLHRQGVLKLHVENCH
ncbi:alpha-N-acetylneuraminate alpha-2,8-sialyltransferase ST8SIA3-like [Saccoglossus kowalevskii]|uniref:Sia-alpha-2,3-Gal-beta-1,4-GlcNAc-R:alpha 2,8-sialyltransferase-like n=1 Tax=Saccoglossus kowalevskii TaxID=10224 RepID=A0ABM0LXX7_SACKO|nr:PREDICTED: sia-alpha-2,3-Gal-beta-1,4-GlcNAc-R:alpha 2,8-sialyltransferase-like [Saccoglossus kowalevskii]